MALTIFESKEMSEDPPRPITVEKNTIYRDLVYYIGATLYVAALGVWG